MAISEKEYQGLVKMHGEEAVKHLKPEAQEEIKPDENTDKDTTPVAKVDDTKWSEQKEDKPADVVAAKEVSEADFLEFYKKKTGKDLTSFDELLPKESAEEVAEKREASKLAYALQNNIISKKQHDSYILDSANVGNLVFEDFKADALAEDPNLTDEEIQEQYADEYALNADPESAKYKRGQKKLSLLGDKLLREKHSSIFEIDGKYSQFEKEQSEKLTRSQKISIEAPKYKQSVEASFSKHISGGIEIGGKKYDFSLSEADIADIKTPFLSDKVMEDNITKGYDASELDAVIEMAVIQKNKSKIFEQLYNKRFEEYSKGVRGILPQPELRKQSETKTELSDREKLYYSKTGLLPTN